MEIFLIILVVLLVIVLGIVSLLLYKLSANKTDKKDDQSFLLIQNQLERLRETVDSKIGES